MSRFDKRLLHARHAKIVKRDGGEWEVRRGVVTKDEVERHFTNGTKVGVPFIRQGESVTLAAMLDLDNHGGEVEWEDMVDLAVTLINALAEQGLYAMPYRSGGGNGVNLWMVWDTVQDAYSVRHLLREVLATHGYKPGDGGVSKQEIEIFPKQDRVTADGIGNCAAVPYRPLDAFTLEDTDVFLPWDSSEPVPVVERPEASAGGAVELSEEQIDELLGYINPDQPYNEWKDVLMAVHAAGGTFEQVEAWSKQGASYTEQGLTRRKWEGFSSGGGITGRTLMKMAREGGWEGDVVECDLDQFPEIEGGEEADAKASMEAKDNSVPVVVREVNEKFAVVSLQGKIRIMHEKLNFDGIPTQEFMTASDFHLLLHKEPKVIVGEKPMPLSNYWLGSPERRGYEGITFLPRGVKTAGEEAQGYFNTWAGFGVRASSAGEGGCELYMNHVKEVICGGNEEHYQFVVSWMAELIQRPEHKPGCAIVMKGGKGSGKGTFVKPLAAMLGRHYMYVSSMQALLGNFNSHLGEAVLVFADEALWGGDKKADGALKSLITEPKMVLEKKGIDRVLVNSYHHVVMATNEDWVVPATAGERRYMVLQCADMSGKDKAYFDAIHAELASGGMEALMGVLEEWQKPGWVDFYRPPVTDALLEQQEHSKSVFETWWDEVEDSNAVRDGDDKHFLYPTSEWIDTAILTDSVISHGRRRGVSVAGVTRSTVGRFLSTKGVRRKRAVSEGVKSTLIRISKDA